MLRGLRPRIEIVDGAAEALFHPQPEHRGREGWLHGGFAATVLDHVCAATASWALDRPVVTGRLDLRYPQPVPLFGGPYRVTAQPTRPGSRTVWVAGAILGADGQPLVEANGMFVAIDP